MKNKKLQNIFKKSKAVGFSVELGLVGDMTNIAGIQAIVDHQISYLGRVGGALLTELDCNGFYLDQNDKVCKVLG